MIKISMEVSSSLKYVRDVFHDVNIVLFDLKINKPKDLII